ncbi:MAG: tRNA pseudouridine(55) synthase TruB [Weeksellaceae bacterium]|nr:tRNA pseudouridine(55) synthase TruB [Weeksellaceae bacterium]
MAPTLEQLQQGQVFLIDKPLDWTSFDVVNKIRWNIRKNHGLKKFKVGHAGTLDPKATGLLIICTGRKTKEIESYQNQHKAYTGTIKLGATTASYDTEQPEDAHFPTEHITTEMLHQVAQQFTGVIQQLPPIHSAIKKDGKKLYEYARGGKEIDVKAREVEILEFRIMQVQMPFVDFYIACSKGTYIRSIAHDFGAALKSGGYLYALRRVSSGDFHVEESDNAPLEFDFFTEV